MTKNIMSNGSYIFRNDIASSLDESVCTGSLTKTDTCTRTTTKGNHRLQFLQTVVLWETCSEYDISNILLNLLVNIHLTNNLTSFDDFLRRAYRNYSWQTSSKILTHDALLLLKCWIADNNLQHETVHLCLWQWIGTFLLNWVLGSHYEERLWKSKCLLSDCYLMLLHSLKQSTLYLCWSTVDLIGKHEVCEYRTFLHLEVLVLLRVDHSTYYVSREKVRSKLNTTELRVNKF